jgi:hypothetical protein
MEATLAIIALSLLGLGFLAILALPGILAFRKNLNYRWVILILGLTSPVFFGITWLLAILWVFGPNTKTVNDVASALGVSKRNAGDEVANLARNFRLGNAAVPALEFRLAEIDRLHQAGSISSEERETLRSKAIDQYSV